MTRADVYLGKAEALHSLEQVTTERRQVEERYRSCISDAHAAGCSLREIGEAAEMSWSGVAYSLDRNGQVDGSA